MYLEKRLKFLKGLIFKERSKHLVEVFHLYEFRLQNSKLREPLVKYLRKNNIDAKIHYPIPMHLQPAAKKLGHKVGDFPITDRQSKEILTLPVNQYLAKADLERIVQVINEFQEKTLN